MYTRKMVEKFVNEQGLPAEQAEGVLSRVDDVAHDGGRIPALGITHIMGDDPELVAAFNEAWESGALLGTVDPE